MPQPFLKLDWDMVERMLPKSDAPAIVALSNSGNSRVVIPVRLYNKGGPVLDATVTFLSSGEQLAWAALALVESELKQNEVKLDWDAVSFKNHIEIYARKDIPEDPFAQKIGEYRLTEPFPALTYFLEKSEHGRKDDPMMKEYAAVILAHSAEISIPGLKRLPRKNDHVIHHLLRKLGL